MRPGVGADREDAESFAGRIRLSYLGLVRVLESEVPSDAVSFGLVKRKAEEYNLHLWTESARYSFDPTVTSALPKTLK